MDDLKIVSDSQRQSHSHHFSLTMLVLDAVVVGMDMLIKKYRETNKGKKRICLITNALCPIKDPFEGTKEDQVSTIAEQMKTYGMKMESIVVRGKVANDADRSIMDENDRLLNIFAGRIGARTIYVEQPLSLRGALKTRKVTPVTVYRGDLDISPKMRIKVCSVKLPSGLSSVSITPYFSPFCSLLLSKAHFYTCNSSLPCGLVIFCMITLVQNA